jgi:hypothetical protein
MATDFNPSSTSTIAMTVNSTTTVHRTTRITIKEVKAAASREDVQYFDNLLERVGFMPPLGVFGLIKDLWCAKKDHALSLLTWCGNLKAEQNLLLFKNALGALENSGDSSSLEDVEEDSMEEQIMVEKLRAIEICTNMVKMCPVIIITRSDSGWPTALHAAAHAQCPDVVEAIFQAANCLSTGDATIFDALLNAKHVNDDTPLRMAVQYNMEGMVQRILERSSQPIEANILNLFLKDERAEVLEKKIPALKAIIQIRPEVVTADVVKLALRLKGKGLVKEMLGREACHPLFQDCGILHQAIQQGDTNLIDMLLEKFPGLVLELDKKKPKEKQSVLSHNVNHTPELMDKIRKKIVRLTYRQISAAGPSCYPLEWKNLHISEIIRILIADTFRKS